MTELHIATDWPVTEDFIDVLRSIQQQDFPMITSMDVLTEDDMFTFSGEILVMGNPATIKEVYNVDVSKHPHVLAPSIKETFWTAGGATKLRYAISRIVNGVSITHEEIPYQVKQIWFDGYLPWVTIDRGVMAFVDIEVSGDIKTDGPEDTDLLSVAVRIDEHTCVFSRESLLEHNTRAYLAMILRRASIVLHNGAFDCRWLNYHLEDVLINGKHFYTTEDTMLMHHSMFHGAGEHGLKQLCQRIFGAPEWEADAKKYTKAGSHYELIPPALLYKYNAGDVYWTQQLYLYLKALLDKNPNAQKCYYETEMPASHMFQDITTYGMPVDLEYAAELDKLLEGQVELAQDRLNLFGGKEIEVIKKATKTKPEERRTVFKPFNANSPLQVKEWFVEHGERNLSSTDEKHLMAMHLRGKHMGMIEAILDYRGNTKARSTYVTAIIAKCDKNMRVHPTFKVHGTSTGRIACVTSDTLIDMPRDMVKYPEGVPITEVKAGDWVYSFDWRRELTLRQVSWVGQTGVKATVVVTFQNSEGHVRTLRCTPEHLVRLRNGDWRAAGSLLHSNGRGEQNNPRVMAMVRRGYDPIKQYTHFFPHSIARGNGMTSGGINMEHRWIVEQIFGRRFTTKADVHHNNGTKIDNTPSNLRPLSITEHRAMGPSGHARWGEEREVPNIYLGPNDYRVISVVEGETEPVWDMTVPVDHQFVANGIVVHNSSGPNIQNVPNDQEGKPSTRRMYRTHTAATVLIGCDYKQAELRVMAELCGDERMIGDLQADSPDFFTNMMPFVFPEEDFTTMHPRVIKKFRLKLKRVVYGSSYGLSASSVAQMLTLEGSPTSKEEAQAIQDGYLGIYPGLRYWREYTMQDNRETNLLTPFGRQLQLDVITDATFNRARNQAWAFKPQAIASDICVHAALDLHYNPEFRDLGAHLTASVHDALYAEGPTLNGADIQFMIEAAMTASAAKIYHRVPFLVDGHISRNWNEL